MMATAFITTRLNFPITEFEQKSIYGKVQKRISAIY